MEEGTTADKEGTTEESREGLIRSMEKGTTADKEVCRWFRFAQLAKGKKSRP